MFGELLLRGDANRALCHSHCGSASLPRTCSSFGGKCLLSSVLVRRRMNWFTMFDSSVDASSALAFCASACEFARGEGRARRLITG